MLLIAFPLILFYPYFIRDQVPFPANLMAATYEPWRSYPPPEYPNGPPNKAMGFDNVRVFYPIRKIVTDSLKSYSPPLWNPYNFAGNVVLGSYQAAVFHPATALFLFFPMIDAWSIMIILQPILSAIAMYIFLRTLGVSPAARLMGSQAFAYSGFFMTWWQESYMYAYTGMMLPVALTAIEQYIAKPHGRWLAMLAASMAVSVFSGMPQITIYIYGFTALWILYLTHGLTHPWKHRLLLLAGCGLSLLLSAVHLVPSVEAYGLSTRISTDVKYLFDAFLLPVTRLVTLIAPDYYGNPATYNYFGGGFYHDRLIWLGTVPLLLILTQILRRHPAGRHGRFFQVTFLLFLSLMLSLPTTWLLLYSLHLPLLSTMTPTRIMVLVLFCGAVLTAYGTEEYARGFSKKHLGMITALIIVAMTAAGIMPLLIHYLDDKNPTWIISLRNLVIPAAGFFTALTVLWVTANKPKLRTAGYALLLGIVLATTFLFAKKYLYFSHRRFVYPDLPVLTELKRIAGFDRFWTYENGYIEKNFASYYGLFSPEGYEAYMIRRYGELLSYANTNGKSTGPDRSNALIQSTDRLDDIYTNPYRAKLLRLLGVKYIVRKLQPDKNTHGLPADPPYLPTIWNDGTYAINEDRQAAPRVFVANRYVIDPDGKTMLERMFTSDTDLEKTVFLEKSLTLTPDPTATGSAHIVSYEPNTVTVEATATGDAFLFLSDVWYPGWNAYVDGMKTEVYRADYAFRGLEVPKGNHQVIFRYEPRSWINGIAGTAAGIAILTALTFNKRITYKPKNT